MSSYITTADAQKRMRDEFGRLYDLPLQQSDLDEDILAAEAIVNSYLGARYTIPVTASDALAIIKTIALDLLEELAYLRAAGDQIPEKVKERADVARQQLEKIADGSMTLAGAAAAQSASSGSSVAVVDGNDPQFTRDQMGGF